MAQGRDAFTALRDLSVKAASLGLERACRLVVVVVSAKILGEASFGRFVFASTVTALAALATELGLGVWTTRALARTGAGPEGERIVRVGLELRALAALPYAAAIGVLVAASERGESRAAMALLGVAALLNGLLDHFGAILRGFSRFTDEGRLNATRAVLTAVVGLATLAVERSLTGLSAGLAAASGLAFAYGGVTLARLRIWHPGAWTGGSAAGLGRSALREAAPIWIAGLLSLLYFKVDTLFLRSMAGDAELGAYGAAYKVFEGAMIVPAAVLAVAFPRLSRAHGDRAAQGRLERRLAALLLGLGLSAGAVAWLGRTFLVAVLFGPAFVRAEASLAVLALGLPLVFLNYGLTHFLLARDRAHVTTWLSLMMLVVTVALDVTLIPRAAGPGAAWATVLAEVALTTGCWMALAARDRRSHAPPSVPAGSRRDQRAA